MLLGQAFLGKSSDRYGRKPVIILGLLLNGTLFVGLIFVKSFVLLFPVAILAGLGDALFIPAIAASYLDIAKPEHISRVMGIKGSVAALAGVVGPLLVAIVSTWTTPANIFAISAGATLVAILLALFVLKGRSRIEGSKEQVQSLTS
jgi:MFS family permease